MATDVLQHVKIDPEFSLGYSLHAAMTRHGKSLWSQVREIWRLRYGPGKLRPDEYYYYGLFDDRRFAFGRQDALSRPIDPGPDHPPVQRRRMVVHRARQAGVLRTARRARPAGAADPCAVPRPRAASRRCPRSPSPRRSRRICAPACAIRSSASRSTGIRSIGVAAVERYDAGGDALVFMGGSTLALDGFVKELEPYRKQGYLFQEMLRPHPEVAALCGPRRVDRAADRAARGRRAGGVPRLVEDSGRRQPGGQFLAPRQPARGPRRRGRARHPGDPGHRRRSDRARPPSGYRAAAHRRHPARLDRRLPDCA